MIDMNKNVDGKVVLITGGTGSFGQALTLKLLQTNVAQIRIVSRDEKKQNDMRQTLNDTRLKFYIGDVRDQNSLREVVKGVDYIFHAAALKQVPSCEFFPLEAVKTNVLGTENVLNCAIDYRVQKIVLLSTDKAVYPVNVMGMTKALMEKLAISKSREEEYTKISITRYGNVMASRGSVIPLFVSQILKNEPITVTDPNMTRFMMSLDQAIDLVFVAFDQSSGGETFVHKAPSVTVASLVTALCDIFEVHNHPIVTIGTRHGEKDHEVLVSREEMQIAEDIGDYYKIPPDVRNLRYDKFFNVGKIQSSDLAEFSSKTSYNLDDLEVKNILLQLPYIQKKLETKKGL